MKLRVGGSVGAKMNTNRTFFKACLRQPQLHKESSPTMLVSI